MPIHLNIEDLLSARTIETDRIEFKQGWNRSIRLEAFSQGQVRSRRYRNRRLGEFLKELELTEGRATGIPTILKALHDNGSPAPRFYTDDDRTFFEVELFIHPEFATTSRVDLNLETVTWDLQGSNQLLNLLVKMAGGDISGGITGNQAGNQADIMQNIDNQVKNILKILGSNQVATIAGGIAGGITEKQRVILEQCLSKKSRNEVLTAIRLSNQRKNYVEQMLPLVETAWLTMTVPDKPTSLNQKYLTTLKGRLVLEILKSAHKR